ncbi:hypothetical protein BD410DRAFT_779645 [Rickenella mellea]|uniref:DUF6593 domain-containing protein n=1 Tax=Rickenella mellea TaxID=50990 RepID=A0A4R5XE56_9AGAM|nr:hypothetical protein BD410DRAFT_779645 [Rickenella mellea]
MAGNELTLRWVFPSAEHRRDIRSFHIYHEQGNQASAVHLYKVCVEDILNNFSDTYFDSQFQHISTGTPNSVTTFHRWNAATSVWELAGEIAWTSDANATIHFGATSVHIQDLRRRKKASSKSRRFRADGSEYKWKIADNNSDLFCVDSRGKIVATWIHQTQILKVERRVEGILDRLVITCLLHVWFRLSNRW